MAVTTNSPTTAFRSLSGIAFHTAQTTFYTATLHPRTDQTHTDLYIGCLFPDGWTSLSLVQGAKGAIGVTLGSSPVPFATSVSLTETVVPFSYTFVDPEPIGQYFTYAGLAVAGSNPFLPANQLSLSIQGFRFTP